MKKEKIKDWLNCWADYNKNESCVAGAYRTPYGDGYKRAVKDIMDRLIKEGIL